MTDENVLKMVTLIHEYVTEYGNMDDSIFELVEDAVMSMDETTNEADRIRVEMERLMNGS